MIFGFNDLKYPGKVTFVSKIVQSGYDALSDFGLLLIWISAFFFFFGLCLVNGLYYSFGKRGYLLTYTCVSCDFDENLSYLLSPNIIIFSKN